MKARTDAAAETLYSSESFENFAPSTVSIRCVVNEDSGNTEPLRNGSKSSYESCNCDVISNDSPAQKKLYPLHFNTSEALDKTPAIFKSLNSGTRGPDTFVFNSTAKLTSLPCDDDPCKTFVVTNGGRESPDNKRAPNVESTVIGGENFNSSEGNEYLSYIIQKNNESYSEKMNNEIARPNSANHNNNNNDDDDDDDDERTFQGLTETDVSVRNAENEISGKVRSSESEVCDTNVKKLNEDTIDISFDRTITGKKEQTFARLQDELQRAHQELKLKDEEVTRLTRIREDVERELEELTASLFQEAHKMVSKAKEKQAAAEKSLKESQMKVDVLTAEVVALKTLVLTSTPSRPNPHLHPQIGKDEASPGGKPSYFVSIKDSLDTVKYSSSVQTQMNAKNSFKAALPELMTKEKRPEEIFLCFRLGVNLFNKKHRRSPSHFNLKYGRENSPPESPVRNEQNAVPTTVSSSIETRDISEVDPVVHKEFMNWSLNCKLDKSDPFIDRIYREDINLCLDFSNRELAEEVQKAIETKNIFIEAVTDKSKTIFPRKCALLEVTRQCHYRMKLGDGDAWHNISQMCRNRIIAVCDFINYLRYIELGLVKSSAHDMYWEIMRLRKEMVLARLGLSLSPP